MVVAHVGWVGRKRWGGKGSSQNQKPSCWGCREGARRRVSLRTREKEHVAMGVMKTPNGSFDVFTNEEHVRNVCPLDKVR